MTGPDGGDEGDRTLDLTDANRTLSQLSYAPKSRPKPLKHIIFIFNQLVKHCFCVNPKIITMIAAGGIAQPVQTSWRSQVRTRRLFHRIVTGHADLFRISASQRERLLFAMRKRTAWSFPPEHRYPSQYAIKRPAVYRRAPIVPARPPWQFPRNTLLQAGYKTTPCEQTSRS